MALHEYIGFDIIKVSYIKNNLFFFRDTFYIKKVLLLIIILLQSTRSGPGHSCTCINSSRATGYRSGL